MEGQSSLSSIALNEDDLEFILFRPLVAIRDITLTQVHQDEDVCDTELAELEEAHLAIQEIQRQYRCMEERMLSGVIGPDVPKTAQDLTFDWIRMHLMAKANVSVPRCIIFEQYLDYCNDVKVQPVSAARFGKTMRTLFPFLTIRRLGSRRNIRYHYGGVSVRPDSILRDLLTSSQRINRFAEHGVTGLKLNTTMPQVISSPFPDLSFLRRRSCAEHAAITDGFPCMRDVTVPAHVRDKVGLFLLTYRHHCQSLEDAVVETDLAKVPVMIEDFWGFLPEAMRSILDIPQLADLLCLCDVILYQTILGILTPRPAECMPERLKNELILFTQSVVSSVKACTLHCNNNLQDRRNEVVEMFARSLNKLVAVSHLSEAVDSALYDTRNRKAMLEDWRDLDLDVHVKEFHLERYWNEFETMLKQGMSSEQLLDWVSNLCHRQKCDTSSDSLGQNKTLSQSVWGKSLLAWSLVSRVVLEELTLNQASTLGFFHLISMLIQDYLLHLRNESELQCVEQMLQSSVKNGSSETANFADSVSLGDSSLSNTPEERKGGDLQDTNEEISKTKRKNSTRSRASKTSKSKSRHQLGMSTDGSHKLSGQQTNAKEKFIQGTLPDFAEVRKSETAIFEQPFSKHRGPAIDKEQHRNQPQLLRKEDPGTEECQLSRPCEIDKNKSKHTQVDKNKSKHTLIHKNKSEHTLSDKNKSEPSSLCAIHQSGLHKRNLRTRKSTTQTRKSCLKIESRKVSMKLGQTDDFEVEIQKEAQAKQGKRTGNKKASETKTNGVNEGQIATEESLIVESETRFGPEDKSTSRIQTGMQKIRSVKRSEKVQPTADDYTRLNRNRKQEGSATAKTGANAVPNIIHTRSAGQRKIFKLFKKLL